MKSNHDCTPSQGRLGSLGGIVGGVGRVGEGLRALVVHQFSSGERDRRVFAVVTSNLSGLRLITAATLGRRVPIGGIGCCIEERDHQTKES